MKNRCLFFGVFASIALIVIVPLAFALDPQKTINQYGHNVWFRQNGLPANAVYVGLQARDGYLWLGTSAGLFRFDGVNFNPVNTNPNNSNVNETISSLCMSKDSSLWIGTTYSGLRRIKDGKLVLFGSKEGLDETQIRILLESRTGKLWIGTSYGLYTFSHGKFESIPINPKFITALAEDSVGRIWVGTHTGVRVFDDVKGNQIDSITVSKGLPHDMISSLYTDHQRNVWIGTVDGLARWVNGSVTVFKWPNGLTDNHITAICEDRDKNLWFGTCKGINRFFQGKWTAMTSSDGLTNNNVLSVLEDREGSIWVCTLDGLNQFKDVNITTYTTRDGLASDNLSSVLETPDGRMYFFSNIDGSITQLNNGRYTVTSTRNGPAYVAHDGTIWVGQTSLLLNIHPDHIKQYDTQAGVPVKWISAITEDDESLLMFVDGIGIRRFVNGRLQPYVMNDGKQYPLTEYVTCFYSQSGGSLWIGTSHGLVKIQNGKDTTFLPTNGLAGNWVSSIFDDQHGRLWISSPRDGLTRLENGKFTPYTIQQGLFTNEIYCVLTDDRGDLWMSSPRGIGCIQRQQFDDYDAGRISMLHTQVYVTADGMKSDECFGGWQPAGWKAKNSHLWFATKKGAVMIDPNVFKRNVLPPPVLIEKVIVDQRAVPLDQMVKLESSTEKLEFHYTALSFLVPERVLFRYKLEGYDRDWVEAGTRRVAYYTNLHGGEYRFRVIGCNNDGIWNMEGSTFGFDLETHYYETYWFYGLVLIVLGGIVVGIIRIRVWRLLQREKELQERIQEALANIKKLGGLIPICSHCKKIRNDKGYWDQLEAYIQNHSEAKFSHGICPDCAKKIYPDISTFSEENQKSRDFH